MNYFHISILFFCFTRFLSAAIIEVDSLHAIQKQAPPLGQNALVLFDVDDTLLIPNDAVLRPCGKVLLKKYISQNLENPAIKYPYDYLHSEVLLNAKSSVVDPGFPQFIKQLQHRKIPAIAFTAAPGGKLGRIHSMADWRIDQLKKFGFDFSQAFPNLYLEFPKQCDKQYPPLFKSGVLFSSRHPKGPVLSQFLKRIHLRPTIVVLIDDKIENLETTQCALDEMGIEFIGFYYTAAEKLPCYLDEKIAEFQFCYLVENGVWLSDEEARNAANSPTCSASEASIHQKAPGAALKHSGKIGLLD